MSTSCGAKRLDYIAARIADTESDVRRLRQIIDRQLSGQVSMGRDISVLLGEIDQIKSILDRARCVCQALLADREE